MIKNMDKTKIMKIINNSLEISTPMVGLLCSNILFK